MVGFCFLTMCTSPSDLYFDQNVDKPFMRSLMHSCSTDCLCTASLIAWLDFQYCTLPLNVWANITHCQSTRSAHRPRRGTISAQFGNTAYCTLHVFVLQIIFSPCKGAAKAGDSNLRRKRIIYEHIQHLIYSSKIIKGVYSQFLHKKRKKEQSEQKRLTRNSSCVDKKSGDQATYK